MCCLSLGQCYSCDLISSGRNAGGALQGLLQQVLGGNEDVVVTAGKKGPNTDNAFFQLEVSACCHSQACASAAVQHLMQNHMAMLCSPLHVCQLPG